MPKTYFNLIDHPYSSESWPLVDIYVPQQCKAMIHALLGDPGSPWSQESCYSKALMPMSGLISEKYMHWGLA